MPDFKLSVGKDSNPPLLPLAWEDLLFLSQQRGGDWTTGVPTLLQIWALFATGSFAITSATDLDMNNAAPGTWRSYNGSETIAAANNWPLIGDAALRWWNLLTIGTSNRTTQLALHSFNTAGGGPRAFIRFKHDSTWSAWREVFHTGNFDPATKANLAPAVQTVTSAATVTPTYSNDLVQVTAQAAALSIANPTGTAVEGWGFVLRIKDNGTSRTLTWDTQYRGFNGALPAATVAGKWMYFPCVRNSVSGHIDVLSTGIEQ